MVRFIHTADLHLDRPFEGLSSLGSQQEQLLTANLNVLKKIISLAITEQVDFILIAGDTFHQNRPSLRMQRAFIEQLKKLKEHQIAAFIIFGNHDFYQAEKYWFTFPDNVTLFTKEQVTTTMFTTKHHEKVAISGFSFEHAHIVAEKAAAFPNRAPNVDFHIGMYHGGQKNYAPFQVNELVPKGYDYWALGHIHVAQTLQEKPLILYPGAPQGHTQKETQIAGVWLVESSGKTLTARPISVAEVIWHPVTLSLKPLTNVTDVVAFLKSKLVFEQLTIVQLELGDYEQLGDEFIFQVTSLELLHVLQEVLPRTVLLQEIDLALTSAGTRASLDVDPAAVAQVLATYEDSTVLQDSLAELYQQPELHRLLVQDPEFGAEVRQTAKKLLNQDFQVGGDVS
jgi:DNA repair exonuclease SbcCD nuclease subunit